MASAAVKISDKGIFAPFLFSDAESSPAFCQSACVISTYGNANSISSTVFFSFSVLTPWMISKRTVPQLQTQFLVIKSQSFSPVSDRCLKNSIQTLVSARMLFFKKLLPFCLSFHFHFLFFFPVIINVYLSSQRYQFFDLFLADILFHGSCYRLGLRLFTSDFCTCERRSSGMFNVAPIAFTFLTCSYRMEENVTYEEALS